MPAQQQETPVSSSTSHPSLPPGYVVYYDVDGQAFAVPQYLVPSVQLASDGEHIKTLLGMDTMSSQVCTCVTLFMALS
jgi:hypothetical protein